MGQISWVAQPRDPRLQGGEPVGVASHGQYWRGWRGDYTGDTWFAVYMPDDGSPVELANHVSAGKAYRACTDHNASRESGGD